ncbi:hypothetical protein D3C71_2119110 [compost metagenome]
MNPITDKMPVLDENKVNIMPPRTTQDKKCGKYSMVCKIRLNALPSSSFNISASRIGNGKPKISL